MEIQTFHVKNIREGLERIKSELGPNAVIVSTNRVPGPDGKQVLEIAAAAEVRGTSLPRRKSPSPPPEAKPRVEPTQAPEAPEPSPQLMEMLEGVTGALGSIQQEMSSMRAEIRRLELDLARSREPALEPEPAPSSVAEETFRLGLHRLMAEQGDSLMRALFSIHQCLISQGVLESDVEELIATVLAVDLEHTQDLTELVLEQMAEWLRTCEPIWEQKTPGAVDVHVLVGPSGVGKTTTLAKIAAHARYAARRQVALLGADAFRIGANFQLETYAELLDLPMETASDADAVRRGVDALTGHDMILVDTTGYNLWEPGRSDPCIPLEALATLWPDDADDHRVHLHLVLAANTHTDDLLELLSGVSHLPMASVMFTKIDEARNLGAVLSVVRDSGLPVSLLSDGRAVPGDVRMPQGRELAEWILRGYARRVIETEDYVLEG